MKAITRLSLLTVVLLASTPSWAEPVRSPREAQQVAQAFLARGTVVAKVGAVREVGQSYEVELVTGKGTLVDRLVVDKVRGNVRSLYGSMLLGFQPAGPNPVVMGGPPATMAMAGS